MIIYQIPKASDLNYDNIIGVIDCSGSMNAHWEILADHWNKYIPKDKAITITFDTFAEVVESNFLDKNINYHGGGGTSIATAFELLEEKISYIPQGKNILILFISDGQDNSTIVLERKIAKLKGRPSDQRIDFICLGIGKDFPTFVAMRLRRLYHSGDDTIPAIFLIEYVSQQAFTNKFESLKPFFECNKARSVLPKVCLFPWRENTENVFENSWVISDSKKLILDGKIEIEPPKNYFDGISELFRSWAQTIHLDMLNEGESVVKRARKTLIIMKELLEEINVKEQTKIFSFDGETLEINASNQTDKEARKFKSQAFRNIMKRHYSRLKWYFDDVKDIAEGKTKTQNNQFEVAKLLGLGTIFGGYNQRILKLKRITVDDYIVYREEFKKIYSNTKLNAFSSQEKSIISLQNQKDLFIESDFQEGLELCRNQIDLFESFPLVGHALRVSRNELSFSNPYFIEVNAIAKCNATVDTLYINANGGNLRLSTGVDQYETINAVLPLLGPEDGDMHTLINSKLFNLAMTFNVIKNSDSLFEDSYLALLASTLSFVLINEPESEWKDNILSRINTTAQIILKSKPGFCLQMEKLVSDTHSFIRQDNDQMIGINLNISKSILMTFLLAEAKKLDIDAAEKLIFEIFTYIAGQRYFVEKRDIVELLALVVKDKAKEKLTIDNIVEKVKKYFPEFFSKGDLERCIEHEIKKEFNEQVIVIDCDRLPKIFTGKVSFDALNKLNQRYLGRPIDLGLLKNAIMKMWVDQKVDFLFFKDLKVQNSKLDQSFYQSVIKKFHIAKTTKASVKTSKLYKLILPTVLDKYYEFFESVHHEVIPIPLNLVHDFCKQNGVSQAIVICEHSLLAKNACMAPNCKFYLRPRKYISHHFHISKSKFPKAFHSIVKRNYFKSADEIYTIIQSSEAPQNNQNWSDNYGRSKHQTIEYIQKLKNAYIQILG